MSTSRTLLTLTLAILIIVLTNWDAKAAEDPLPSWNDGPVKKTITEFVTRVTTEGGPDLFRPPSVSPRSTTTVRSGPNNRFTFRCSSRSIA